MYGRELDGRVLSFGHAGILYENSFVMYDRQTSSLWVHATGRAESGPLKGPTKEYDMPPPSQAIVPLDVKISKRQVTLTAKPDKDKGTKWGGTLTAELQRGEQLDRWATDIIPRFAHA